MTLLNVRLDAEDARRAKALRSAGAPISALVRDAIRAEYDRRGLGTSAKKPSRIVAEVLASLPDPPDLPPVPSVDASDRHAVRRHIAARLARGRTR